MQLHQLYESALREGAMQSCAIKFGDELFGDELGGDERNTSIENKYARLIATFTNNKYGHEMTDAFIGAIERLYDCVSVYPDVLIPDKTTAYRGTTLPVSYFINNSIPIPVGDFSMPYTYKGTSIIQSWTVSMEVSLRFGNHDVAQELSGIFSDGDENLKKMFLRDIKDSDLRIPFVLEYQTTANEFMFKAQALNALSQHGTEDEILRIDNRPIQVNAIFNNSSVSGFNQDVRNIYQFINDNLI